MEGTHKVTPTVTVEDILFYPDDARIEIVEGTLYLSRDSGYDVSDLDAIPEDGAATNWSMALSSAVLHLFTRISAPWLSSVALCTPWSHRSSKS